MGTDLAMCPKMRTLARSFRTTSNCVCQLAGNSLSGSPCWSRCPTRHRCEAGINVPSRRRPPRVLTASAPPHASALLAASAALCRSRRLNRSPMRWNTTKKMGTKKTARMVEAIMPPNTAVPRARCPAAPAPSAISSGTTPRMKANEVITIGRKRSAGRPHGGLGDTRAAIDECRGRIPRSGWRSCWPKR